MHASQYFVPKGMITPSGSLPATGKWTDLGKNNKPITHLWRRSHWSSWMFEVFTSGSLPLRVNS